MTKLTSAFTHTCITGCCHHLTKLLSQVLQWGKHAPLPFTGLFRLDPCRFIGIQTAATVAVLTGSGQSLSEPTLWFTTTNDNLPITINLFKKNRGQNSMQIIESTCCHFFLPLQLFGNEPQYFAERNTQSACSPGESGKLHLSSTGEYLL